MTPSRTPIIPGIITTTIRTRLAIVIVAGRSTMATVVVMVVTTVSTMSILPIALFVIFKTQS